MPPRQTRNAGQRPALLGHVLALVGALGLTACALPERPASALLYDFGAGTATTSPLAAPALPALALSVQATPALDGAALHYRLAYADAQQLRTYAQARWTMAPAELLQQRLRQGLGRQRPVLRPGEGAALWLNLELEEFSQVFDSPSQSAGVLRLRATLQQAGPTGPKTLAQRSLQWQAPAPSADAAGGVRALTLATDAAVLELDQWLQSLPQTNQP